MDPVRSLPVQFLVLAGTFAVIEIATEMFIANMAHRVSPWLRRAGRRFNQACGGLFVAIGHEPNRAYGAICQLRAARYGLALPFVLSAVAILALLTALRRAFLDGCARLQARLENSRRRGKSGASQGTHMKASLLAASLALGAIAAAPAASAQDEPGDDRHVLVPGELVPAAHAGRPGADDRALQRHARGDDVQEAPDREAGRECRRSQGDAH